MEKEHWDKEITKRIKELGVDWEKARMIVGLIAEERQIADQLGYKRGYEQGYISAKEKFKKE